MRFRIGIKSFHLFLNSVILLTFSKLLLLTFSFFNFARPTTQRTHLHTPSFQTFWIADATLNLAPATISQNFEGLIDHRIYTLYTIIYYHPSFDSSTCGVQVRKVESRAHNEIHRLVWQSEKDRQSVASSDVQEFSDMHIPMSAASSSSISQHSSTVAFSSRVWHDNPKTLARSKLIHRITQS